MEEKTNNTWEWDAKVMEDDEGKEALRNDPLSSADLVFNIINTLDPLLDNIVDGTISWFSAVCLTKDMWDATNFARLWTEKNHEYTDSLLQDSLGHIAEAHYMIEGMWAWDKFTETGMRNVAQELASGILTLRKALLEVEHYLYTLQGDTNGHDEG